MDSTSSGRNPLVETNISPPENSCLERLFPVWGQFWRILNRVYPPTSHTRRFGSVFFLPQGLPLGLQWRFGVRFGTASSTQNLGEFSPKVGVIFRWFLAEKSWGHPECWKQMERWSGMWRFIFCAKPCSQFCRTGWCPEECGDLGWNTAGTVHRKRWQRKALLFGDIQLDCHITRCLLEREATFMQIFETIAQSFREVKTRFHFWPTTCNTFSLGSVMLCAFGGTENRKKNWILCFWSVPGLWKRCYITVNCTLWVTSYLFQSRQHVDVCYIPEA